ncbi:MAG: hypothetical protein KGZ97_01320 [Bacteroidetes bacterium]|nr:hypothetical protein [Bacteroidota bacterium]
MRVLILLFAINIAINDLASAQSENMANGDNKSFNLAMQSRASADTVLQLFDTAALKLLYSIDDKNYWIITKESKNFKEYYVRLDSCSNILENKSLGNYKGDLNLVIEAFNIGKYNSELIFDSRGIISAKKYFVIKDKDGKRYAECSVLSLPFVHIDENLDMYIAMRLAEFMYLIEFKK